MKPENQNEKPNGEVSVASAQLENRFANDHETLCRILSDVELLAERRSFVTASKRWGEAQQLEQRHSALEEETLANIEKVFGSLALLREVREAHHDIQILMTVAGQRLSEWSLESFRETCSALMRRLVAHWEHEQVVVVPTLRELFKNSEMRADFLEQLIHS